jgi:hypothetical protein
MEMNMRFEDELYEAMSDVYPSLTVRAFSHALGMSSGYWSSITAQELPVSNVALINLNDYLECRKVLMNSESVMNGKINGIQQMIASEIARRFLCESAVVVDKIWPEIEHEFNCETNKGDAYNALPFVMSRF